MMSGIKIPFFKPYLTGQEIDHIEESIHSLHWSGDGPFTRKCADILRSLTKCPVYLTPSGSAALELAMMTLGLEPGDEVILPSYTFPSTANAVVQAGLRPVFIDIRADTLNLDETLIEPAISERTRALVVVHYAGMAAEMDSINTIAKRRGLLVVEDAAHGVNAFWHGKVLGALGDLGIYSFHQTKNFSCGEGGAIVVNNERFHERVEIHRQKGTNRSQFLLGKVDKYSWVDRGSNYLLSDILAAFLFAQLENIKTITDLRRNLFDRYCEGLRPLSKSNGQVRLPVIPEGCKPNYHFFFIRMESATIRQELMKWLLEKGIESTTHFVPLHSSAAGRRFGVVRGTMNVTDSAGSDILRLPLFPEMSIDDTDYVVENVTSFFKR